MTARLAAVQFKGRRHDVARGRAELAALADRAALASDLVVLPEMAASGYLFYSPDDVARVAEDPDGPGFVDAAAVARRHGVWVIGGFAERCGDRFYNAARVIDPTGRLVEVYRKTLLYEADLPWATPGDRPYPTFETDAGRIAVGICMDLNDDRFVAWLAGSGADWLVFPTNWVKSEGAELSMWGWWRLRLRGCGCGLVAANTWGREDSTDFVGCSSIFDRDLQLVAAGSATGDGIVRWARGS